MPVNELLNILPAKTQQGATAAQANDGNSRVAPCCVVADPCVRCAQQQRHIIYREQWRCHSLVQQFLRFWMHYYFESASFQILAIRQSGRIRGSIAYTPRYRLARIEFLWARRIQYPQRLDHFQCLQKSRIEERSSLSAHPPNCCSCFRGHPRIRLAERSISGGIVQGHSWRSSNTLHPTVISAFGYYPFVPLNIVPNPVYAAELHQSARRSRAFLCNFMPGGRPWVA